MNTSRPPSSRDEGLFGDIRPNGTAKRQRAPNPCVGAALEPCVAPTTHYQVHYPFTDSLPQLTAYAKSQQHTLPAHRETDDDTGEQTEKVSFDDDAIRKLRKAYPKDTLYPLIDRWRVLQKAYGTYLGKLQPDSGLIGSDGRLRDRFRHTPKTLRLAMELLQVLPRPVPGVTEDDPRRVYDEIRKCFVPAPGHEFVAADFSGIEPLLVAYFAAQMVDPTQVGYLRACRLGSHSWLTSHVIGQPVDIMGLSDADVLGQLDELSKGGPYKVQGKLLPWKQVRQATKTTHMASLYAGGPGEILRSNPDTFTSTKEVRHLQEMFFAAVPIVPKWHWAVAREVESKGYIEAPSGFRLYGDQCLVSRFSKRENRWVERLSRTAKEMIAAVPQHTGMMYTATAAVALATERPDLARWLRLLIHDEIFAEVPQEVADGFLGALMEVMGRPHERMPLWPEASAVMGGDSHLRVAVEAKRSLNSWGEMV